jgi:hypothetical protein
MFPLRIASVTGYRTLSLEGVFHMERSLLQPIIGAVFMGLGAGFLTYAYSDRLTGKKRKKPSASPQGFYDPARDNDNGNQARMLKAISAGFFLGVMSFFYFANR